MILIFPIDNFRKIFKIFNYYSLNIYEDNINAIISPYNPNASANIRISIIPTNILSCCPRALAPASPTSPIASPAA
jgi:hypothetical protein